MTVCAPQPLIWEQSPEQLTQAFEALGYPAFRVTQLLEALYKKRFRRFADMVHLPLALRQWLEAHYALCPSTLVKVQGSSDETQKFLSQQRDGALIETVLIRAPHDTDSTGFGRKTVCISTQVGCAYGCKFCASGLSGWKRDLSAGEIIGQLMHVCWQEDERLAALGQKTDKAPFDNIVVMGMGEPLANYDNLMSAIRTVNASWGLHFGARRITVSTSGLVPQIRRLAEEPIQFRLAISLHGATNDVREQIMPVNKRYPLELLLPAAQYFASRHKRMITLEYILIEEVNDSFEQAQGLRRIAQDLHAHVNLIPYNAVPGLPWKRPSLLRQNKFIEVLQQGAERVSCTIRREKGHDIAAACGQLRLQTVDKEGNIASAPAKLSLLRHAPAAPAARTPSAPTAPLPA
jgi:23S rRNA (adenine2503-C2)-methyltransferase